MALEIYTNNDQQFDRHNFLIQFCRIIWYNDIVMDTYTLNDHVC